MTLTTTIELLPLMLATSLLGSMLTTRRRIGSVGSRVLHRFSFLGSCVVALFVLSVPCLASSADNAVAEPIEDVVANEVRQAIDPRNALTNPPVPSYRFEDPSIRLAADSLVDLSEYGTRDTSPIEVDTSNVRVATSRPPVPTSTLNDELSDSESPELAANDLSRNVEPPRLAITPPPVPSTFVHEETPETIENVGTTEVAVEHSTSDALADVPVGDVSTDNPTVGRADDENNEGLNPQETAGPTVHVRNMMSRYSSGPVALEHADGWRVVVGPHFTEDSGRRELEDQLVVATREYVDRHIGQSGAADFMDLNIDFIRQNLLFGTVENEMKDSNQGPTRYMTVVLRFDQEFQDDLHTSWTAAQREARLKQIGFGTGGVLALLATVFGFLKVDSATDESYRGRLQIAAATVILTLTAAGVFVAHWIPWI